MPLDDNVTPWRKHVRLGLAATDHGKEQRGVDANRLYRARSAGRTVVVGGNRAHREAQGQAHGIPTNGAGLHPPRDPYRLSHELGLAGLGLWHGQIIFGSAANAHHDQITDRGYNQAAPEQEAWFDAHRAICLSQVSYARKAIFHPLARLLPGLKPVSVRLSLSQRAPAWRKA